MSAPKKTEFTVHDKTYYADPATVNFVRPGLVITIKSAAIAADGTITVDYTVAGGTAVVVAEEGFRGALSKLLDLRCRQLADADAVIAERAQPDVC